MSNDKVRIGVDIGGTFTDVTLVKDGLFHTNRVLTSHQACEQVIMTGMQVIMSQTDCKSSVVESIIHGTTLATNIIIENKGARIAK